ncbi:hypothetical protein NIES4074_17230 [Cylindrospermum sp. NIES-4074]|nr:hypothetical protein NIES4074_17230 [Cylindrospermum sp. NIES-4074]
MTNKILYTLAGWVALWLINSLLINQQQILNALKAI